MFRRRLEGCKERIMVQVDVFWSFALGAGFAASAAPQLRKEGRPFESPFFVRALLYLSILFVPSGAVLLWGFPEWETMQVGSYRTIPAWLVGLFNMTNITQGILGFWVAYRLIRAGRTYGAWLMAVLGYFCMFFILVHGWDGTGYQRFFYCCKGWGAETCTSWSSGAPSVLRWVASPVAVTLIGMGGVMLPLLFYWMSGWVKQGYEVGDVDGIRVQAISRGQIARNIVRLVFLHSVSLAIAASFLVRFLGWIGGVPVFAGLAYLVFLRRGGLTERLVEKIAGESRSRVPDRG
jgi:hypothetical protein